MKTKEISILFFILIMLPVGLFSDGVNLGIMFGSLSSVTDEAMVGYPYTEFEGQGVLGFNASWISKQGPGIELMWETYEMELEEFGVTYGTLKCNPILLMFKFQTIPWSKKGLTFWGDIGSGTSFNSFDANSYIFDRETRESNSITVEQSFVFGMGAGLGYFLNKDFSIGVDLKMMITYVDSYWDIGDWQSDETFYGSNFQLLLAGNYWF
jgi:hypothetical protein